MTPSPDAHHDAHTGRRPRRHPGLPGFGDTAGRQLERLDATAAPLRAEGAAQLLALSALRALALVLTQSAAAGSGGGNAAAAADAEAVMRALAPGAAAAAAAEAGGSGAFLLVRLGAW